MTTVALSPLFNGYQGLLPTGQVNNGGLINVYAAGTTTPVTTYTTSAGNIANTNPIVLDSTGKPPAEIWLPIGASYKFVITDSGGNNPSTYDNIPAMNDPTALNALTATVAGISASLSGYAPLASPTFTGTPAAPTPSSSDNSTTIATTAFVKTQLTTFSGFVSGARKSLKVLANGSDKYITVTAAELAVETAGNNYGTLRNVSVTIDITTTGVANGLDTGVPSASTWYYVYVIYNGTAAAGLISLSSTSPTLPAGYTYYARVGAARTDGTAGKMLGYTQNDNKAQYKVGAGLNLTALPSMATGAAGSTTVPTWSAVAVANFVPPTASNIFCVLSHAPSGTAQVMLAPNNGYGAYNSLTNPPPFSFGQTGGATSLSAKTDLTLEGSNIYWASSGISATLSCIGWQDSL